jgi:phage tail protein X
MKSFNYNTTDGDRIDLLSQRFYGGMYGISIIADANPEVPMYPVYPIGTSLIIPIIEDEQVIENTLLPPWRR